MPSCLPACAADGIDPAHSHRSRSAAHKATLRAAYRPCPRRPRLVAVPHPDQQIALVENDAAGGAIGLRRTARSPSISKIAKPAPVRAPRPEGAEMRQRICFQRRRCSEILFEFLLDRRAWDSKVHSPAPALPRRRCGRSLPPAARSRAGSAFRPDSKRRIRVRRRQHALRARRARMAWMVWRRLRPAVRDPPAAGSADGRRRRRERSAARVGGAIQRRTRSRRRAFAAAVPPIPPPAETFRSRRRSRFGCLNKLRRRAVAQQAPRFWRLPAWAAWARRQPCGSRGSAATTSCVPGSAAARRSSPVRVGEQRCDRGGCSCRRRRRSVATAAPSRDYSSLVPSGSSSQSTSRSCSFRKSSRVSA